MANKAGVVTRPNLTMSKIASEAMANAFYIVKINSSDTGKCDLNDTAGEQCLGVIQEIAASGQAVAVCYLGSTRVVCGAAVSPGDPLQGNGSGKAITATTADNIIGFAVDEAEADGDIIEMTVVPAGIY